MSETARAELKITGHVQGVTYRASTRRQAQERGLYGWVENQPDGSVEAVVEGSKDAIEGLVEWAHTGPKRARVESVEVDWTEPTGEFSRFKVHR